MNTHYMVHHNELQRTERFFFPMSQTLKFSSSALTTVSQMTLLPFAFAAFATKAKANRAVYVAIPRSENYFFVLNNL